MWSQQVKSCLGEGRFHLSGIWVHKRWVMFAVPVEMCAATVGHQVWTGVELGRLTLHMRETPLRCGLTLLAKRWCFQLCDWSLQHLGGLCAWWCTFCAGTEWWLFCGFSWRSHPPLSVCLCRLRQAGQHAWRLSMVGYPRLITTLRVGRASAFWVPSGGHWRCSPPTWLWKRHFKQGSGRHVCLELVRECPPETCIWPFVKPCWCPSFAAGESFSGARQAPCQWASLG